MELWTIIEPGAGLANNFYFTRGEAEAALEEARPWDPQHPEDAAALAVRRVERIVLDDPTPTEN